MKININQLSKKPLIIEEVINVPEDFKINFPLSKINNFKAKCTVISYEDFIDVFAEIEVDVILKSVYSLKEFSYVIKAKDEYHFSSYADDEDSDLIEVKSNIINMDEYLLNLMSASIPVAPKIKGEKLPKSGVGYEIISEDEYNSNKETSYDSRFDKLKDIDFD